VFPPDVIARQNLSARHPTQSQIKEWEHKNGYDKPKLELFENHMKSLLLLQFGKSDKTQEDIGSRIVTGAVPSLELASLAFFLTLGVGLALAVIVAYLRGTYIDSVTMALAVISMSIPIVVYVIALQFLFGKLLRYGPVAGYESGAAGLRFMVLPVLVALVSGVGYYVRLYRTFMLDETGQDYVRTARAKGLRDNVVLFKHVLKNALIPVITTTVSAIPSLILGNLVLESFFGIPGLGNYLVAAINGQDFAVVRAMVYVGTLLYIVGLVLTDILYAVVDPRVRIQ
jgi:peptide/nickel transport system permease protein